MSGQNAWEKANKAAPPTYTYFGQCFTDAQLVAFEETGETKANGKPKKRMVPFDADRHERSVAKIDIEVVPLPEHNAQFNVEQSVPSFDRRWHSHTKKSLDTLGHTGADVNEQWVQVEKRPTGKKYSYVKNGERISGDETALIFLAVYPDEATCRAAYSEKFGAGNQEATTEVPANSNGGAEKETAKAFLPALWAQANGDLVKMQELLESNPLTGKFFTIDSPEVVAIVQGGAA
jgi:hypothetical protein